MAALMYDPRSKGAESYIRLAKEIIERQAAYSSQPSDVGSQLSEPGTLTTEDTGVAARPETRDTVEEISKAPDEMDKSA
jgi:hypothetical protein